MGSGLAPCGALVDRGERKFYAAGLARGPAKRQEGVAFGKSAAALPIIAFHSNPKRLP